MTNARYYFKVEQRSRRFRSRVTGRKLSLGTEKSIVTAVRDSILGEKQEVRRFLATSADAEILLIGKDSHGNLLLFMVTAERYPRMVTLFLDRGAQSNSQNNAGRTPLMEAALGDRFENSRTLLAGQGSGMRAMLRTSSWPSLSLTVSYLKMICWTKM